MFKPGDRVRVTCTHVDVVKVGQKFVDRWTGYVGTVIDKDAGDKHTYIDGVDRPDIRGDYEFQWPTDDLELVQPPSTVDDLRQVVSSLREQGYTVEVKVARTVTVIETVEV